MSVRPYRDIHRRRCRKIHVGKVPVGGDAPITVQSMTNTVTSDVAAPVAQVRALEAGRPDLLPGPTYAIGFVRAYSDHLGLDGSEILRRFKAESAGLDAKPDLTFPMPLGERSIPGRAMLLVALILVLCGYGTWYYLSTAERSRPERVAELPIGLLSPPPAQHVSEAAVTPSADAAGETQPIDSAGAPLKTSAAIGSELRSTAAGPAVTPPEQTPAASTPGLTLPPAPPPVLIGLAPTSQGEGPHPNAVSYTHLTLPTILLV